MPHLARMIRMIEVCQQGGSEVVRAAAAWGIVAGAHHAKSSRHDIPTSKVGLAGTQLSSSIYGTVVFD